MLEGIEKAERNVLPVLNNLLENREMQLEDGRFLMAPERYVASGNQLAMVVFLKAPLPPFGWEDLHSPLSRR